MVNENIKKARENAGISQRELGRRISKTGQYISYLEKNPKANPSIIVLSDIATALNIPLSHLIESQETLTNKLIKALELNFKADAANTLELICEFVDIDTDVIDEALKNDEDISESYLSKMLTVIYNDNPKLFYEFYKENSDLINDRYWICSQTCDDLLKKMYAEKPFDGTNEYKEIEKMLSNEKMLLNKINDIENKPSYLLKTILNYLKNVDGYDCPIVVHLDKEDVITTQYFTQHQIEDIITKISELVKYEVYKIEKPYINK